MKEKSSFGSILKRERTKRSISQEQLAALSGLHRTYISLLERELRSPTLKTITKIAAALKIELPEMLTQLRG